MRILRKASAVDNLIESLKSVIAKGKVAAHALEVIEAFRADSV